MRHRTEHDGLGEVRIPSDKYYGAQTQRAIENFKASGTKMFERPKLIRALGAIKKAAAMANLELGILDENIAHAIIQAAQEVYEGKFLDQFPIDMIQGGAGTSANMNANEVICNRALEIMGHKKGQYQYIHPNNHVNLSQSTNDVYPTAVKLTIIWLSQPLLDSINLLKDAFFQKAKEFKSVIKMGRTQLQDAVPMTLGQEFTAFAVTINEDIEKLIYILKLCYEINMGATAIGTGINTLPGYAKLVCEYLGAITGFALYEAEDLVEATSDTGVYVSYSSTLKRFATKLTKICNDLRLLSSGPSGARDIELPAVQPGSSIMPGKVNPVIPEAVNQICFQIIAYDLAVTLAASNGQLQLNAFEPLIVYDLMESITLLRRGATMLREKCVMGIKANAEYCRNKVLNSAGLLTAFTPYIGYEVAAKIAAKVKKSNTTVYQELKKLNLLDDKDIEVILAPETMTSPNAKYDIVTKIRKKQEKK